ncbi:aldehyde dehydrogenase family protein [Rhodococcus baikonurensis]|uniref:aldehyde dehydrogenase family protein n=1 Tax=Rhodococcus baikonurensis TaxID=172041 RepID=UPI0037B7442C
MEQQFRASFPTVTANSDFTSIIDDKNYRRVVDLIEDARSKGAQVIEATPAGEELPSAAERKIARTILTDVTQEMDVMTEEVFGPVLSVMPYENLDAVIEYINARPSPLAVPSHVDGTAHPDASSRSHRVGGGQASQAPPKAHLPVPVARTSKL